MVARALLFALVLTAGCGGEAAPSRPPESPPEPFETPRGADPEPDTPAPVVFDTTEPAPPTVEIPVRPPPPPMPEPLPPPPPQAEVPGSCDVRGTESFCFAYTGVGWSAEDARDQCREAPASTYRTGACPTSGRIATCIFRRPSDPTLEIVYTYYAPYDLGLAEVACLGEFERIQ